MKKKIASQLFVALLCLLPIVGMAQNLPDLIISNLEVIDPISPNYDISYQYQITNIGDTTAILDDITIQAFISDNQVFNPDTGIPAGGKVLGASVIEVGQTITETFGATVIFNIAETPYLTMKVDSGDDLNEAKEDNNTAFVLIPPPPTNDLPDLIISGLRVLSFSSNDISYEYQITNIGNTIANIGDVSVQAFICENQVFSPIDIPAGGTQLNVAQLAPNQTITQTFDATANFNIDDTPYLTMKVDWGEILEELNEQNNTKYAFIKPPKYTPIKEEVVKRQLIINWNSLEDRINNPIDFKKITDLLSNNADKVATCDCKSRIELWEIEEDEDLDAILSKTVDIDGGTKSAREVVENDSDQNLLLDIGLNPKMQGFEVLLKDEPDSYASYQRDVSVYLIDTGVSTEFFGTQNHPTAWRHFKSAASYCSAEKSQGYNYTNPPNIYSDYHDENGHGTFGFHAITSGLPDKIRVVPLKAFDKCGQGTLFGLICAMNHAVENEANIINVSAGYLGEPSSLLEDVIKAAEIKGIWIVAAAGNDSKPIDSLDDSQYPAAYAATYQNVISVASLDTRVGKTGKYAKTSNYGKNTVTIAAYGNKICQYANKKYPIFNSGTSMAAYHVTRALAIEISTSSGSANFNRKEFIDSNSNESTTDPDKPSKPTLKMTSSKPKSKFIPAIRNFLRSIGIDA